jgi:hypothetical protein
MPNYYAEEATFLLTSADIYICLCRITSFSAPTHIEISRARLVWLSGKKGLGKT